MRQPRAGLKAALDLSIRGRNFHLEPFRETIDRTHKVMLYRAIGNPTWGIFWGLLCLADVIDSCAKSNALDHHQGFFFKLSLGLHFFAGSAFVQKLCLSGKPPGYSVSCVVLAKTYLLQNSA